MSRPRQTKRTPRHSGVMQPQTTDRTRSLVWNCDKFGLLRGEPVTVVGLKGSGTFLAHVCHENGGSWIEILKAGKQRAFPPERVRPAESLRSRKHRRETTAQPSLFETP